jgi:arylsulfatase A-like enzyme
LERKGYLNDYIAVITGDHGEGFGEHRNWGHTQALFIEHINIPILLFGNPVPREISASFASQIDIAPTILHELGLPIPATWEGYAFGTAPERRDVFLTSKQIFGGRGVIRVEKNHIYTYLLTGAAPGGAPEHLFDLVTDPHERNDLIGSAPSTLLNDLRRVASRHFRLPSAAP